MNYRKAGKTDIMMSEVSVGSWAVGDGYFGSVPNDNVVYAMKKSFDLGVNHVDTAELYGGGLSERLVGEAVKGRRDKTIISSKVWTDNFRSADVIKACEGSLSRLGTDYIDFLYMHYYSHDVPLEETMGALLKLKEQGKIRYIGASNFPQDKMRQALKIGRIDLYQPCFSLLWRFFEDGMLDLCRSEEIGVVAYSPLAQGLLTGKYGKDYEFSDGRSRAAIFQQEYYEGAVDVVQKLKPYSEKYGVTIAQIAIKWVTVTAGVTSAIVGAKNANQAEQNAKAADFELSMKDYHDISDFSRKYTDALPKFRMFFSSEIAG